MNEDKAIALSDGYKKENSEFVFDSLSDILFDRILLLNNSSLAVSGATADMESYTPQLRVPDTSGGKFVRPDKKSRFRTAFYVVGGVEEADFFILSPCVYPEESISSFAEMTIFKGFVGVRILRGQVYLVTYGREKIMKSITAPLIIKGTSTNSIDILYNINSADVYINNQLLGTIETDFNYDLDSLVTTYPVMAPIRSVAGQNVNLTFENYQFLQER